MKRFGGRVNKENGTQHTSISSATFIKEKDANINNNQTSITRPIRKRKQPSRYGMNVEKKPWTRNLCELYVWEQSQDKVKHRCCKYVRI